MSRRSRSRGARAPKLRRTWPQRLLIGFNVVAIVVALVGAGSLAYAKRKVNEIDRIRLANSEFAGSEDLSDGAPRNFLIVGADEDDGLDADDPARAGRDDGTVAGVRSDTIMVVRIDPAAEQAKILSFPRDLWVDIPGSSKNRINASIEFGGTPLLIDTIKANFDIDINHYVQVNFAGFQSLVEQLGGVPVYFAAPVRDAKSGLNVETAGCTTLDENGALSYVRARALSYQDENGRWRTDGTGDLGRISRQQDFIKRVLVQAISQGARNPVKLANFVDVGVDNITLDDATTPGDLVSLGRAFKNYDPNTLDSYSLPVTDEVRGGAAVLDLISSEAEPILAQFRGTGEPIDPNTLSPALVAVQVLNGSGIQDQAGEASAVLSTAGFQMDEPSSAAPVERTEVRYAPGMEAEAVLVARHLFADPVLIADVEVGQVTVVTGPDFGAAVIESRPEADIPMPTTTTTTTTPTTTAPVDPAAGADTTEALSTTSTTEVTGFVPDAAPEGADCG